MEHLVQETDRIVLHIRNMVCPRCIMVVRDLLENLELEVLQIELGYAEITTPAQLNLLEISKTLEAVGFEYIWAKNEVFVEKAKICIIEYIHELEKGNNETVSQFLSKNLGMNYASLSRLFSKAEGRTIQTFLVLQKIERVKELLDYGELSLSQIAFKLGYSSVHYLSLQFRKVTGLSVSAYKEQKLLRRKSLDKV